MATTWWKTVESTVPKAGPSLASPVSLGSGNTAGRPSSPSNGGYYNDTTVGKRVYWDAYSGKWRDAHGVES